MYHTKKFQLQSKKKREKLDILTSSSDCDIVLHDTILQFRESMCNVHVRIKVARVSPLPPSLP